VSSAAAAITAVVTMHVQDPNDHQGVAQGVNNPGLSAVQFKNPDQDQGHWNMLSEIAEHAHAPADVRLVAVQYIDPEVPLGDDDPVLQSQQHQAQDGGVDRGYRQ